MTTESWNIVLPWITNGRTRTIPRRNIVKKILLFEVWIPSVSIYCGSNLFQAWTWILCLHFRDDSISGSFVGVGQKVKIFTRKRLDAATRGSDPWKRKITIKLMWSILWSHHWHTLDRWQVYPVTRRCRTFFILFTLFAYTKFVPLWSFMLQFKEIWAPTELLQIFL